MTAPKILIVDDEPFNVDYLEQELEDSDYLTIAAVDGQEALAKVRSEAPDLVLLDIMMPGMDGFEVLSRLKADPATRDIPVIIISASNSLQSVVKGIQLGAEDYLPKPFEPVLLHARISSSLEKKRLRDLEHQYMRGLERELDIAREIQQGFLPSELPEVDGWEIASFFKAAREVAGDY
jgi:CheY-like chemotaxis protein